jgi:hypothetical protein
VWRKYVLLDDSFSIVAQCGPNSQPDAGGFANSQPDAGGFADSQPDAGGFADSQSDARRFADSDSDSDSDQQRYGDRPR